MAFPRKSAKLHEIDGTYRKDRHGQPLALAPMDTTPMDTTPPKYLPADALPAWEELCAAGEGVFANSDKHTVEITAGMLTRVRNGETTASAVALLAKMLKSLGLSPDGRRAVDRLPDPEKPNRFASNKRPV